MKRDIHPLYGVIKAICACGNIIKVRSTLRNNISLDVCCACHPFYTGKQRSMDSRGRIHRFNKRFGILLDR